MYTHSMYSCLVLLSLACGLNSEVYFKYGLGVNLPQQNSITEVKSFSIGHSQPISSNLKSNVELGLWSDNNSNRKSASYVSYVIGPSLDFRPLYIEPLWGVNVSSKTDSVLSTAFNFKHEFSIMLKDRDQSGLALTYTHLSNGGMKLPNRGRDFILMKIVLPFD